MSFLNFLLPRLFYPKPAQPRVYRVGISPGHGGEDSGAVSVLGQKEADLARQVAKQLYAYMQRTTMFEPALYGMHETKKNYAQRVKDSNAGKDDFYIPIHFNSAASTRYNGWMILLDPAQLSKYPMLAGLSLSILNQLQLFAPLGFADWDNIKDGVMAGIDRPIYELSHTAAKVVYIEAGFISDIAWAEKCKDPAFLGGIAMAIFKGFDNYLSRVKI